MNIRRLFAVWSAKLIKTACQITGRQGVTLAGKIALSIYPPILKELASEVKKRHFRCLRHQRQNYHQQPFSLCSGSK